MLLKDWKIFYADGTTYSSNDGKPENAVKIGVQAIIVSDDRVGRRVESSEDFYIWTPDNGGWRGANHFRMSEYLYEKGSKVVLFGRTMSDEQYADVMRRAQNDHELPPKSARKKGER